VTLDFNESDEASAFLDKLEKSNKDGFAMLRSRIEAVAARDRYENQLTFKHVGNDIFEFKRPGLRLYAFYDSLPGLQPQLIIATNGGTKNTAKEQQRDIARAINLKTRYEQAKSAPSTAIKLIILPHEN